MSTRSESDQVVDNHSDMSVGPYLQQLRKAQGHTLEQVSMRIKYSTQQIQALEQERWDVLPSGTPLRWLVRSYGRFLEVDDAAIQAMLDSTFPETVQSTSTGDNKMKWEAQDMSLYVEPSQRAWGWWLVALVLLVVVLFYAIDQGWIPESWLIFDWLKALSQ